MALVPRLRCDPIGHRILGEHRLGKCAGLLTKAVKPIRADLRSNFAGLIFLCTLAIMGPIRILCFV
jgi:hypothetical protein